MDVPVRRLSESEFKATFSPRMRDVTDLATDVLDIWPYVRSIPSADLDGHAIRDGLVDVVYRSGDGRFDHVLVGTGSKNVVVAVVVDLERDAIHGHRLLDLNREYGLREGI